MGSDRAFTNDRAFALNLILDEVCFDFLCQTFDEESEPTECAYRGRAYRFSLSSLAKVHKDGLESAIKSFSDFAKSLVTQESAYSEQFWFPTLESITIDPDEEQNALGVILNKPFLEWIEGFCVIAHAKLNMSFYELESVSKEELAKVLELLKKDTAKLHTEVLKIMHEWEDVKAKRG